MFSFAEGISIDVAIFQKQKVIFCKLVVKVGFKETPNLVIIIHTRFKQLAGSELNHVEE